MKLKEKTFMPVEDYLNRDNGWSNNKRQGGGFDSEDLRTEPITETNDSKEDSEGDGGETDWKIYLNQT